MCNLKGWLATVKEHATTTAISKVRSGNCWYEYAIIKIDQRKVFHIPVNMVPRNFTFIRSQFKWYTTSCRMNDNKLGFCLTWNTSKTSLFEYTAYLEDGKFKVGHPMLQEVLSLLVSISFSHQHLPPMSKSRLLVNFLIFTKHID